MASNGSTNPTDTYRQFFENFQSTVNINDPLPVKVGSHSIRENEVDGEIVDWTLQYLQQKNCPSKLLAHLVSLILWEVRFCISKDDVDAAVNRDRGYEPVKLMQMVTSKINNVCLDYLNNQKFESLCTELSFSNRPIHPVSVHAIRNGRRKMEDRHVVIQDLNKICSIRDDVPTSYYAVFDGHAGTDAAFYSASQLHEKMVLNPKFATNPSDALREAFLATDSAFVSEHENERLKGGTTAVVCLVRGNLLVTAWLGDSQAVLVKDGIAEQLVNPHKPDRSDEKERISNLGGEVIFWDGAYRVNGQLAVSRAIGDAGYKPYVTAEPDMVAMTLEGNEDFLIIGCDGLWDTIGVDEAAFIVLQYLHHETDISGLSGRLVQAAKQKGSSDNITVIVVFFREPELIARRPLPPVPTSVQTNNTPSMEQQQEEYEKLAAKWSWNESQGGAVFDESSWTQQQTQQNPFDSSNPFGNGDEDSAQAGAAKWAEQSGNIGETIPDNYNNGGDSFEDGVSTTWRSDGFNGDSAETPEVSDAVTAHWGWKDPEIEALEIEAGRDSEHHFAATSIVPLPDQVVDIDEARQQYEKVAAKWGRELEQFESNGAADLLNLESKSDFHLSSDGSTWDQTSGNTQPTGVDWNQYDEELSGQPSLIFVGQSDDQTQNEQIISPIEDLGVNEMNSPAVNEISDHQMWASDENSVSFPPAQEEEPTTVNAPCIDGSFVDEGIAGDEADFTCSSSSVVESVVPDCQPDVVAAAIPSTGNDPDFHWNLHAPEFEFQPTTESTSPHELQQTEASSERKLSATELLIRSSNDAQLAVLLAAANDDPDEMEPQEELDISPRSDALDDIHNASNAINESKGDGTIDAEDSEDDWTFNDYRKGTSKEEESVTNSEVAESSLLVEAEPESKIIEGCNEVNCQANDLGSQLEKLTVDDVQNECVIPTTEPEMIEAESVQIEDARPHTEQVLETQSTVISSTVEEPQVDSAPAENVIVDHKETEEVTTTQQEIVEPRIVESPVSDSATVGSETAALVVTGTAIGVAATAAAATAVGTSASKAKSPAAKKPTTVAKKPTAPTAKTATTPAKPAAKEVKKPEPTTRRAPTTDAKATTDSSKPARPTKLSPLRKATPATSAAPAPKPAVSKAAPAAKPPVKAPATKPPASKPPTTTTATTAAKKTTTTTSAAAAPKTTAAPTRRVASAPTSAAKTASPAKPATSTSTTRPAATTSTPPRRTVSAAPKPSSATSRPATTSTKPSATPNGDVKPKPATSISRTPAKPTVNGTATKTAPTTPKPTAAAKPATTRPAPLKSVAAKTATPAKPTAASKPAPKVGTKTPSRPATKPAPTETAPPPAVDTPKADDVKE